MLLAGALVLAACGGSGEAAPSGNAAGGTGTMVKGMDTDGLVPMPSGPALAVDSNNGCGMPDQPACPVAPQDAPAAPAPEPVQAQAAAPGGGFPAGSSGLTFADGPRTWSFDASGSTATITGCTGCSGSVAIPATVTASGSTATVTAIDAPAGAGRGVFLNNGSVTSVTIPGTVASVGDEEFQNATGITSMSIPDSVTSIGYCSFCGMTSLTSMTIGSGLKSIGGHAFHWQTSYTGGYALPASVTSMGGNVFNGTPLTSLSFAGNAPQADDAVLSATPALPSITVQGSATGWTDPWKGKAVTGLAAAQAAPAPQPVSPTKAPDPVTASNCSAPAGGNIDWSGCDKQGADLRGAPLFGANLTGANLTRADLTGAKLPGAKLPGANLYGIRLGGANLKGADLTRATLRGNLQSVNLTGANLTGADLSDSFLASADLVGANLTAANLSRANLTGANLTGANLTGGVTWNEAICPSGKKGPYPCKP